MITEVMRVIENQSVIVNDLRLITIDDLKPIINNLTRQIDSAEILNENLQESNTKTELNLIERSYLMDELTNKFK